MGKVIRVVLVLLVAVGGGGFGFLQVKQPAQRPAPDLKVDRSPERVKRGDYLANHVYLCVGCHSEPDFETYGMPAKKGTEFGGGFCFNKQNVGFPGEVCAQNLSSDPEVGIGAWSDGEILRAMREGVDRHGKAIFPMMPYEAMANMSDEDAESVVAYLRTLPPIKNTRKEGHVDFPLSVIMKFIPKPLTGPVKGPDANDHVARGKYLSYACRECHTPIDNHNQMLPGKDFSGGHPYNLPGLSVVSANITFDDTGLGKTSREQFLAKFTMWRGVQMPKVPVAANTLMPWGDFSAMTDQDLSDLYDYLQTVPKVANVVQRRPPPEVPSKPAEVAGDGKPPTAAEAPNAEAGTAH